MVRPANVARSRACDQCKRKRIKCDLSTPSCQRCVESSLHCSGPISGLLMVNSSSTTFANTSSNANTSTTTVTTNTRPPNKTRPQTRPTQPSTRRRPSTTRSDPNPASSDDFNSRSLSLTLPRVPSPSQIFSETLLWTFLNFFTQGSASRAWSARLPFLRAAKNKAAMTSAAKAVSLAFAARNMNDPSLAAAACEEYGASLRFHQFSFKTGTTSSSSRSSQCSPNPNRQICKGKALNALPVTVLLSYFEMIQPTSADAWLRHTTAAERLFVLVGPDVLRTDDLLNHLYFIVKSNAVIRGFITGQKTQLVGDPWSDVRMNHACGWATPLFNEVVDLIARVIAHFDTGLLMGTGYSEPSAAAATWMTPIVGPDTVQGYVAELDRLWNDFEQLLGLEPSVFPWIRADSSIAGHTTTTSTTTTTAAAAGPTSSSLYSNPNSSLNASTSLLNETIASSSSVLSSYYHNHDNHGYDYSSNPDPNTLPAPAPLLQDQSTSLTISFFHAATIQVLSLLLLLPQPPTNQQQPQSLLQLTNAITHHAHQILLHTRHLSIYGIGCTCLRMLLPVKTVYVLGHDPRQRRLVKRMFAGWCKESGLPGLVEIGRFSGAYDWHQGGEEEVFDVDDGRGGEVGLGRQENNWRDIDDGYEEEWGETTGWNWGGDFPFVAAARDVMGEVEWRL